MKFNPTLMKLISDFGLFEAEGAVPGETNPEPDYEQQTIDKLDRSAKFDEVDSVTFGLETDDGKIVKVYVKSDQAEDFEKALSTKLGELDDIEEVLNELSKEFEIIDVDWPDEDVPSDDDQDVDDGSEVMDKKVYKKDELQSESLYGEKVALEIMESASSIESRFTTAAQLMVYHAIVDLGVPEIALARSAYRAAIIRGIKDCADEIQGSPSMKSALKAFIKKSVNYDEKAEQNKEEAKPKDEPKEDPKDQNKKEVKESKMIIVSEDKIDWDFSLSNDELSIKSTNVSVDLDAEETEKMVKGITNRDAVVVKDINQKKKVVFSPRGSNVLVKLVGSAEGSMMTSKDVDELLDTISPEKEKVTEGFQKHMVGKFSKNGETFYLWQNSEGGYSYQLTKNQGGKFAKVKNWEESLEDVQADLKKQGYKVEKLDEAVKTHHPAYKFKYDHSKPLVDNVEKFLGRKIKPGRNDFFGFPVDVDDSDGTFLELEAVDKDACSKVGKALRAAGFAVKINMAGAHKELSIDAPAKTAH